MSLFEICSDWVAHLHPSHQPKDTQELSEQVKCTVKNPCLECPTAKPFIDQRIWFSDPTKAITTEHEITDQSGNQKYVKIYTKIKKVLNAPFL